MMFTGRDRSKMTVDGKQGVCGKGFAKVGAMAKSLKRMMCVMMAAVLALLPMSAWAINGELNKINENEVEIYGLDLAGEHSVQVDLKIVGDDGAAIEGASFSFSDIAQGNVVYQSPYNNQTGLMTIIVSNGDKPLNAVGDGPYDLGTLNGESFGRYRDRRAESEFRN